jgi:hypothetical protein
MTGSSNLAWNHPSTRKTALFTIPRLESDERVELLTIIDEERDRLNLLIREAVETLYRLRIPGPLCGEPCLRQFAT